MLRLFRTIRYLKLIQIRYRLYYLVRNKIKVLKSLYSLEYEENQNKIKLLKSISSATSFQHPKFTFLNLKHTFDESVDWNYSSYGKLWTYNLNYFDFLQQENISKEEGLYLINDFIGKFDTLKDALEPFPISLRGINWIKFLSNHVILNDKIDRSLFLQYNLLINNLEYHLLGNHLLENAFSLLFGAYYFKNEKLYSMAKKLLVEELNEQVLEDGAHFELTPMYHQIMLFRVLDSVNLIENNIWKEQELLSFMKQKASLMLGWLNMITFKNGNIPLFNDSTNKIAPTTEELNQYANLLSIKEKKVELASSGYRKIQKSRYELIVDVGNIGPDYIPGHAHSDTFNFELFVDEIPIIVDTGISTYETNVRRIVERSTDSHNTVMVAKKNQSEVWGGFRVGQRAKIIQLDETENSIEATHDGYKSIGAYHRRKFTTEEKNIFVEDFIEGEDLEASAYIHFHPDITIEVQEKTVLANNIVLKFDTDNIELHEYDYAPAFNRLQKAKKIKIDFTKSLRMEIKI